VTMSDSYGDGWQGNVLHIGSHTFTLSSGSSSEETVCLEPGTYTPYACGGSYLSDVSWSVGGLSGGADDSCVGTSGSFSVVMSLAPSLTPVPSITLEPTLMPTPARPITTAAMLTSALADNANIELAADITLSSTIDINGVTGVVIDGQLFNVDGNNNNGNTAVRCFKIGNRAEVTFINLTITNGFSYEENGGGLYIKESTVTFTSCTISENKAGNNGGGLAISGDATNSMTSCIVSEASTSAQEISLPRTAHLQVIRPPRSPKILRR